MVLDEKIAAKELELRKQEQALYVAQATATALQVAIGETRAERDAVLADLQRARSRLARAERAHRDERLRSTEVAETLTHETQRVTYTELRTEAEQRISPLNPACDLSNYTAALPAELGNEVWEPYTMQFVSRMKWYQIQSGLALERRAQRCKDAERSS